MSTTTTKLFADQYLDESKDILDQIDRAAIEKMTLLLVKLRERKGRLFLVGVGGGAGHAGHAVNDFRKLAGIESYSPSDNISELTARTNDEGWDTTYAAWLKCSHLSSKDMLFVFSVGGGDLARNISPNIVRAVQLAKEVGADVIGVLGRDGGYTASVASACVIVPTVNASMVTPHTESFQALVWHLLVSDPRLQMMSNKWESSKK
ncbi:MAG: SIS domain-containing protein [Planctomycetes bacterium]|nr:SIS domain-containing protein [Planctomycetota bacterium]